MDDIRFLYVIMNFIHL